MVRGMTGVVRKVKGTNYYCGDVQLRIWWFGDVAAVNGKRGVENSESV
jgi:hypothetical protein